MCLHLSGCRAGVERVLSTLSNYLLWLGLVLNIHQQAAAGAPEYVIVYLNMFAKIWININLSRGPGVTLKRSFSCLKLAFLD